MDAMILDILKEFGITGLTGFAVFLVVREMLVKRDNATAERKEQRDAQAVIFEKRIEALENGLGKHISLDKDWEDKHSQLHRDSDSNLCRKIDKLYERLNPMIDIINKLQGYIEAKK